MPKYVIEREIPDAGKLSAEQLQAISQKSCSVLRGLGPQIQWVQSYVTDDKVYCVYVAPSEEIIRKHAEQGEFRRFGRSSIRRRPSDRLDDLAVHLRPPVANAVDLVELGNANDFLLPRFF